MSWSVLGQTIRAWLKSAPRPKSGYIQAGYIKAGYYAEPQPEKQVAIVTSWNKQGGL